MLFIDGEKSCPRNQTRPVLSIAYITFMIIRRNGTCRRQTTQVSKGTRSILEQNRVLNTGVQSLLIALCVRSCASACGIVTYGLTARMAELALLEAMVACEAQETRSISEARGRRTLSQISKALGIASQFTKSFSSAFKPSMSSKV